MKHSTILLANQQKSLFATIQPFKSAPFTAFMSLTASCISYFVIPEWIQIPTAITSISISSSTFSNLSKCFTHIFFTAFFSLNFLFSYNFLFSSRRSIPHTLHLLLTHFLIILEICCQPPTSAFICIRFCITHNPYHSYHPPPTCLIPHILFLHIPQ